jgi:hypothetical protein
LFIIARSSLVLKLNELLTFGETHAKLVIKLDMADNQCCTVQLDELVLETNTKLECFWRKKLGATYPRDRI